MAAHSDQDIRSKYIAVLEERVTLTQELGETNVQLRSVQDKLAASEALVVSLQREVADLQGQLASSAHEAPRTGKPLDRVTSINGGSRFYADVQAAPLKRTRTRTRTQQQAATMGEAEGQGGEAKRAKLEPSSVPSSVPAVPSSVPGVSSVPSSVPGAAAPTNTTTTNTNTTTTPTTEHAIDAHVAKSGAGALRAITCVYCHSAIASRNRSRWERHVAACKAAPGDVRALFAAPQMRIPKHLFDDTSFDDDNDDDEPDAVSHDDYVEEEDEEEDPDDDDFVIKISSTDTPTTPAPAASASAAAAANISSSSTTPPDPNLKMAINAHVKKTGIGLNRKITCIHCSSLIPSNNKTKWIRHLIVCPRASESTKRPFWAHEPTSSHPNTPSTPAPATTTAAATVAEQQPNFPSHSPNPSKPLETVAAPTPLAPTNPPIEPTPAVDTTPALDATPTALFYPIEPHTHLSDGTPNTDRWRAWSDVIRFQLPDYKIVPATGVRVTKFKRAHRIAEYRLLPQAGNKKHHSSVTFGIPERLHVAFLEFMVPGFVVPVGNGGGEEGKEGEGDHDVEMGGGDGDGNGDGADGGEKEEGGGGGEDVNADVDGNGGGEKAVEKAAAGDAAEVVEVAGEEVVGDAVGKETVEPLAAVATETPQEEANVDEEHNSEAIVDRQEENADVNTHDEEKGDAVVSPLPAPRDDEVAPTGGEAVEKELDDAMEIDDAPPPVQQAPSPPIHQEKAVEDASLSMFIDCAAQAEEEQELEEMQPHSGRLQETVGTDGVGGGSEPVAAITRDESMVGDESMIGDESMMMDEDSVVEIDGVGSSSSSSTSGMGLLDKMPNSQNGDGDEQQQPVDFNLGNNNASVLANASAPAGDNGVAGDRAVSAAMAAADVVALTAVHPPSKTTTRVAEVAPAEAVVGESAAPVVESASVKYIR
ncbi:hypothetical protein HDU98_001527 [Podochytrium sp. JEL0797]|nr:hypothetical protein HDU98_001527 [Podochytrium sp. JEL0797]